MVISTVTSSFSSFEDQDQHLKSNNFFNAEEFPQLKFELSKVKKTDEVEYKVTDSLTIRDITKEIELELVHEGTVTDRYGQIKASFEVKGATN